MTSAFGEARRNRISSFHILRSSSPTVSSLRKTSISSSEGELANINFINSSSGSKLEISSIFTFWSRFKEWCDKFCVPKYSTTASLAISPAYAYKGTMEPHHSIASKYDIQRIENQISK